jgi:hypothetical protein
MTSENTAPSGAAAWPIASHKQQSSTPDRRITTSNACRQEHVFWYKLIQRPSHAKMHSFSGFGPEALERTFSGSANGVLELPLLLAILHESLGR